MTFCVIILSRANRWALMFLTIIVVVSLNVAASQAPVMVSDVARLVRTVMDGGVLALSTILIWTA
jgi:hypothetical protein